MRSAGGFISNGVQVGNEKLRNLCIFAGFSWIMRGSLQPVTMLVRTRRVLVYTRRV